MDMECTQNEPYAVTPRCDGNIDLPTADDREISNNIEPKSDVECYFDQFLDFPCLNGNSNSAENNNPSEASHENESENSEQLNYFIL